MWLSNNIASAGLTCVDTFQICLDRAVHMHSAGVQIVLKDQQREVLKHLYDGDYVVGVFPTLFGNSKRSSGRGSRVTSSEVRSEVSRGPG